jgi:hypothetical protein
MGVGTPLTFRKGVKGFGESTDLHARGEITENQAIVRVLGSGAREAGTHWDMLSNTAIVLAIVAAALLLQTLLPTNADVAWLLTVGEKVLDGQRLYIDVLETNPPASVLIYLPAILTARALGLSPEPVLVVFILLAAMVSLGLAGGVLQRAGLARHLHLQVLLVGTTAVLLVLPVSNFAQREHVALICLLPYLAVMAARAENSAPERWAAMLAGVGAGMTLAIKPHFALAIALPGIFLVLRARSFRPLVHLENGMAAAVVATYAFVALAFFPAYVTDMIPLLRDVYIPVRHYGFGILTMPATPIWLGTGVALAVCVRTPHRGPLLIIPYLASTGFLAAFVIQGKGWSYHAYPAVGLAFLIATVAIAQKIGAPDARARRGFSAAADVAFGLALAFAIYNVTLWFKHQRETGALADAVGKLGPPRPRLVVISSDLSIGHPLVRQLRGEWMTRVCSQWISGGVVFLREQRVDRATLERLETHTAREKAFLATDIRNGRPDLILIQKDWMDWTDWALSDPALAEALSLYRPVATIDGVAIWKVSDKP